MTFHTSKLGLRSDPSARILGAKDLLNLLMSCSNLSSGTKKIAMLAPVVYELYNVLYDLSKFGFSLKIEVDDVVEKIVSYIMVYCRLDDCAKGTVEIDNSVLCFEDLVTVWTVDRVGDSCTYGEGVRAFFPVLNGGFWNGMKASCRIGELTRIVLYEVFLLRLCLKVGSNGIREELLRDTRDLAVQTIKGFQNLYFMEILFNTLLEPSLPVSTLMSSEDGVFLQKALYDAVLLVDHSYLHPPKWIQPVDGYSRNMVTSRGQCDTFGEPDEGTPKQNVFAYPGNGCIEDKYLDGFSKDVLPSSGCTMRIDGGRKRKEGLHNIRESRVKHVKYDFLESSFPEKYLPSLIDDGMHCGNEVKNFISDDDMEVVG